MNPWLGHTLLVLRSLIPTELGLRVFQPGLQEEGNWKTTDRVVGLLWVRGGQGCRI